MKANPSDSSRSKDSNSYKDSQVTDENIKEILSVAKLDVDADFLPPPICLKICQQSGDAIIGTLGNFSMIIGKAKAKKTFFINSVIAAVVNNHEKLNLLKGCLPPNKNQVLYFDTEQSRFHVHQCYIRICNLARMEKPDNLKVYCLRKFSPADRLR